MNSPSVTERLLAKIELDPSGCWLWTAALTTGGYGQIRINEHNHSVHRVVYESLVGPIPEGLELDHLCRVRRCVNPLHLEPVTHQENAIRGLLWKESCPKGHPYDDQNTLRWNNGRGYRAKRCRVCEGIRGEARRRAAGMKPRGSAPVMCGYEPNLGVASLPLVPKLELPGGVG